MELKVYADERLLADAASEIIISIVVQKPTAVVCFATGDSPKLTYQLLTEKVKTRNIDFSNCFIIGLDEWLGIPPDNSGSCHYFLHHYLLHPLAIHSSRAFLFNGLTENEQESCKEMNQLIAAAGGIDFMLVGIGLNGHIGFNEPGTDENSLAHVAMLDNTTRTVGQKYFETTVSINKGITLGLKQVMEARTLLMIANGTKKAPVIKKLLEEEITRDFPGSLIRRHARSILAIDAAAASELQKEIHDPGIKKE